MQRITRYPLLIKNVCGKCSLYVYLQYYPSTSFFPEIHCLSQCPFLSASVHVRVGQILEHTPEGHADRGPLREALERAEELCSQVNEGVREKENSDRLEWIQSHVQCEGPIEVNTLRYDLHECAFLC